jgi:hypothetical protein
MNVSRRTILKGAAALPLAVGNFGFGAAAQTGPVAAADIPPILFVHGNGDHAALWMTTLWRMESNGISRDRMFAINFTDPLARTDDAVAPHRRSSCRAGRQFARRQSDSQLHQERRHYGCQPCGAVRRA